MYRCGDNKTTHGHYDSSHSVGATRLGGDELDNGSLEKILVSVWATVPIPTTYALCCIVSSTLKQNLHKFIITIE